MRRCTKCLQDFPATREFFFANNTAKHGLMSRCKACHSSFSKVWGEANRDRVREKQTALRRAKAAEKRRLNPRKKKTREEIAAREAEWRRKNQSRLAASKRDWYERNKEKAKPIDRPAYNARRRERRQAIPALRLHNNMSRAIRASLRSGKGSLSWPALVGYDIDVLRRHLERQFHGGMSWDNYGEWQVDHIVPLKFFGQTFEDTGSDAFCGAWALTNLRPLWEKLNKSKNAKRELLL